MYDRNEKNIHCGLKLRKKIRSLFNSIESGNINRAKRIFLDLESLLLISCVDYIDNILKYANDRYSVEDLDIHNFILFEKNVLSKNGIKYTSIEKYLSTEYSNNIHNLVANSTDLYNHLYDIIVDLENEISATTILPRKEKKQKRKTSLIIAASKIFGVIICVSNGYSLYLDATNHSINYARSIVTGCVQLAN